MSLDNRFEALAEFVAVARRLSFSAAAQDLALDRSVLSRRIARLEERLGVRLLQRTTRRVTLTEAGARFLGRCLDMFDQLDDAEAEISLYATKPTGRLRVALPNVYGQRVVAPLLPEFLKANPALRVELTFSDEIVDLVANKFDAAVRIGALEAGGDFIVRRLSRNPRYLCASPDYIARHGAPACPEELSRHAILHFTQLFGGSSWELAGSNGVARVAIDPVLSADNIMALYHAALAGCGIALLADFIAGADLAAGRLVEVLPEWPPAPSEVSVIYPNAPFTPRKVLAWIDFLVSRMAPVPA